MSLSGPLVPAPIDPTVTLGPLTLKQAPLLLTHPFLPFEGGYAINSDGMHHVAADTMMPGVTGSMIDWFFGWITNTEQYKMWHPRDHVYSEWSGPHGNSTYIGGHHLVYEYIGGILNQFRISFKSPADYFGANWKEDFAKNNVSTAVCGTVGLWAGKGHGIEASQVGHLVHLVHKVCNGCEEEAHPATGDLVGSRMRSRFWLGDFEGMTDPKERAASLPADLPRGLIQHAAEEMAQLAKILPDLYRRENKGAGPTRRDLPQKVAKMTINQKQAARRRRSEQEVTVDNQNL